MTNVHAVQSLLGNRLNSLAAKTRSIHVAEDPMPFSFGQDKKQDLVHIQWFVAIACAYLILFRDGQLVQDSITLALLVLPLGAMLIFLRLPDYLFSHRLLPHAMVLLDTLLISTAIVFNRESPWDLCLIFFFGILFAAIGESLLQIVAGCMLLGLVSVLIVPIAGYHPLELDSNTLLRIPLLFGASIVYGYLADQVKKEKKKTAELEATRQHQLEIKDQFFSHVSHELRTPLTAI